MGHQEIGGITAVAIDDKDKNSQQAVKWALENTDHKSRTIILVHVFVLQGILSPDHSSIQWRTPTEDEMQNFFLPFRGLCARKGVEAKEVVLVGHDVAIAMSEYIAAHSITNVVVGASSRGILTRAFKHIDVPTSLGKSVPDFCSVYSVSSRGKAHTIRTASRSPTRSNCSRLSSLSSLPDTHSLGDFSNHGNWRSGGSSAESCNGGSQSGRSERRGGGDPWENLHGGKNPLPPLSAASSYCSSESMPMSQWENMSMSTISSASSGNSITSGNNNAHMYPLSRQLGNKNMVSPPKATNFGNKIPSPAKTSTNSMHNLRGYSTRDTSFCSETESELSGPSNYSSNASFGQYEHSVVSDASSKHSISSGTGVEEDPELKRLKQELKRTLDKLNEYSKQKSTAKQTVRGGIYEETHKFEDSKLAQEVQSEKHKSKAAIEAAEMARRKKNVELRRQKEAVDTLANNKFQHRRYTIEEIEAATNYFAESEMIGEGGYGPVFKAVMDCTDVAIKVLRPDISQGQKQFQQEIDVLSRLRHPNMVRLMGACHEYGCLVYEYMDNGSLDDRLFCKNNTPPIPWNARFKIAAEIATALHFLHQTKPAPFVHRDIKPANILLDRNYDSKISDVGLARLVPPSVADCVTQYQVTAAAGTFCYIDPEYQQTGKLSTKSDIYSLGVLLLQIITARPPIGLTHHVERAIEEGRFADILDPAVSDWPVQDALSYAKLALKCCELNGKDRPDLGSVILPELERLRDLKIFQKLYP